MTSALQLFIFYNVKISYLLVTCQRFNKERKNILVIDLHSLFIYSSSWCYTIMSLKRGYLVEVVIGDGREVCNSNLR